MKKSFLEQILFVCGSLITCALILLSAKIDLPTGLPQIFESRVAALNAGDSLAMAATSDRLMAELPASWISLINSSYLADLRDRVLTAYLPARPSTVATTFAACPVQEIRHTLQGDLSPLVDARFKLQFRSLLNGDIDAEVIARQTRLDHLSVTWILASVHPSLAPATESDAVVETVAAIVVVEHKCAPNETPNGRLNTDPLRDDARGSSTEEATINDAPFAAMQDIASNGSPDGSSH